MKTLLPYVKLIKEVDGREHAWRVSRPKFKEENLNLDEIGKMDLSLNSLRIFILEIQSSTIFRDMIFALRPIDGWALSTRSMPINEDTLRISSEFSHYPEDHEGIEEMLRRVDAGESRDATRELLPTTLSTKYTIAINFRVLMSFLKSLRTLNRCLFDHYGALLIEATNTKKEFEESTVQPAHNFTMIKSKERIHGIKTLGNMVFGHYEMKMALASQFLRQHYSKIKIDYWNMVPDYYSLRYSQRDKIAVVFYIDEVAYSRLMSMRAHWVLDWSLDMWGTIVGEYIDKMTPWEFWNFIPNGNGKKDPYYADVYNRIIGEDPGLPCPIMCQWPEMLDLKEKEIGHSPVLEKYRDLVSAGYLKDNPNNIHRIKYLEMKNAN